MIYIALESGQYVTIATDSQASCKCQGLYERRFTPLYEDRNAGGTSAAKCWRDRRLSHNCFSDEHGRLEVSCECCTTYKLWKTNHPTEHKRLVNLAAKPLYYEVKDKELITVICDGHEVQ